MAVIEMKELLEAGVHFGHQTRRWNPKMALYIYQQRNGIHIIDLQKTTVMIDEAYEFLRKIASEGKTILFVGTKKQAQEAIKAAAQKSEMYYVDHRWLGGMLTNFKTIKKSVFRLNKITSMEEEGIFDLMTKKEVLKLQAEKEKLEKNLGGIKEMDKLPGALVVVDPVSEKNAVAEAKKLGIPVVALLDTNANPDSVDYVIPANNDALRSITLIMNALADAIVEARKGVDFIEVEEEEIENDEENEQENEENE